MNIHTPYRVLKDKDSKFALLRTQLDIVKSDETICSNL